MTVFLLFLTKILNHFIQFFMNQNDSVLADLPLGWKWVKSSDILDIRDGTHDTPSYIIEEKYPLVTSKNLKDGKVVFSNVKFISETDYLSISKRSKVDIGDILFAMIGTIGNPVLIKKEPNFAIKNIGLFKNIQSKISSELLKFFLESSVFEKQLEDRKLLQGTTQKFIPLGNLRNIDIPLPPLSIQAKIVEKLETLLSELDRGKAQLLTAQAQLKTYRQAVLKYAFEGKLTGDTEGWKKVELKEILKLKSGNGLTSKNMLEQGFPVYGGNGISGFYSEFMFDKPVLILGRVGAKCGVVHITKPKSWVTDNALIVDSDSKLVDKKYLYWVLLQLDLNKYSVSTAQPVISGAKIYPIKINLPPLSIQQKIVSEIESRLSVCDKLEETIKASLLQSESLRQSVLKRAFEGKLV
jgi:type I restriction enzyme, S subunit